VSNQIVATAANGAATDHNFPVIFAGGSTS
jgi:hypothetical protein